MSFLMKFWSKKCIFLPKLSKIFQKMALLVEFSAAMRQFEGSSLILDLILRNGWVRSDPFVHLWLGRLDIGGGGRGISKSITLTCISLPDCDFSISNWLSGTHYFSFHGYFISFRIATSNNRYKNKGWEGEIHFWLPIRHRHYQNEQKVRQSSLL